MVDAINYFTEYSEESVYLNCPNLGKIKSLLIHNRGFKLNLI